MRVELTLVRVEQIFGRERVVVYYVADGRVDFRELVRALAAEFQTRIEMKQIGVRDETKLLADVGDCGREVCCNTFLATMPPVSMKMAESFRTLRAAEMLSALRIRRLLRTSGSVAGDRADRLDAAGPRPRLRARAFRETRRRRSGRRRPAVFRRRGNRRGRSPAPQASGQRS